VVGYLGCLVWSVYRWGGWCVLFCVGFFCCWFLIWWVGWDVVFFSVSDCLFCCGGCGYDFGVFVVIEWAVGFGCGVLSSGGLVLGCLFLFVCGVSDFFLGFVVV